MNGLVVFSHGKDASPHGRKISALAPAAQRAGWRVTSIDYTDLADPDRRADRLRNADLGEYSRLVLAGSSMGGYVSVLAAEALQPDGLFLMAPALYLPGYGEQAPVLPRTLRGDRVVICGGWNDDVVPVESAIRFGRATRAELHLFDSDHLLWDVLPRMRDLLTALLARVAAE